MRLHILSDLHLDLAGDIAIPDTSADMVILAGDIDGGFDSVRWAMRTFAGPVILVPGNHELAAGNETKLQRLRDLAEGSTVSVLDNEAIEHGGVRFLGCSLWAPATRRMRACMNESIDWLHHRLAEPHSGNTVVVTHYPPLQQSLDQQTRLDATLAMRMAADLSGLIESSKIDLWVHGHIHKRQDYSCCGTRVVCNPRGYADVMEPRFDPGFALDI